MPPDEREVWITGVGLITPAGRDRLTTWKNLLAGRLCVRPWCPVVGFSVAAFNPAAGSRYAATVDEPSPLVWQRASRRGHREPLLHIPEPARENPPDGVWSHSEIDAGTVALCSSSFADPAGVSRLAEMAARQAVADAGMDLLEPACQPPERVRVVIGTSKGSLAAAAGLFDRLTGQTEIASPKGRDPPACSARSAGTALISEPMQPASALLKGRILEMYAWTPPDGALRTVMAALHLKTPASCPVAACATGSMAVIEGAAAIAAGEADLVICGSSDACIHELWFAAFERMGVLGRPPAGMGPGFACRPFDRDRNGFVLGEGAAILVLEAAGEARRRGARPVARIRGWARGHDPTGLNRLTASGEPLAALIERALETAQCRPEQLAAIQAHGTGTRANDDMEIAALRRVLPRERLRRIPLVSFKGMLGHLLGAAGAVEIAATAMACQSRQLPGNATLLTADPSCAGLYLPRRATALEQGPVLKISLGFGGHLGVVLLDSVTEA